jgi:signal transduction histidine kinase
MSGDVKTVTLRVTDHGIGIAADMLRRIFDRFQRAVSIRQYGGLGLGLYLVQRIVSAHGGSVEVASTPGKGSTFTAAFPRCGPPEASTPTSPPGVAHAY